MLVIVVLTATLRTVDRNLALRVETVQHARALGVSAPLGGLGAAAWIAILVATVAMPFAYLALRRPPASRPDDRYAAAWRLACWFGVVVTAPRTATMVATFANGEDRPSRFAGVVGTLALVALVAVVVLWCADGLTRGSALSAPGAVERLKFATRMTRAGLMLALAFAGLVLAAPYAAAQVGDLVIAWSDESLPAAATFGIAGIALFGLVLQESGIVLVAADGTVRPRPRSRRGVRLLTATFTAAVGAVFVLPGTFDLGTAVLLVPLTILALAAHAERSLPEAVDPVRSSGAGYIGIGVLPLYALAGALANATVDALFLIGPDTAYAVPALLPALALVVTLAAVAVSTPAVRRARGAELEWEPWAYALVVLAVIGGLFAVQLPRLAGCAALVAVLTYAVLRNGTRVWALTFARAAGCALLVAILAAPIATGRGVGTIGIVGFSAAGLLALVHYLVRLFALSPAPALVHRVIPIRRVPILTLLGLWLLLAVTAAPATRNDVAMTAPAPGADADGIDPAAAVLRWWRAQPESRAGDPTMSVPLVLVAAEGGGIRASYWTAGVLDAMIHRSDRDPDDPAVSASTCRSDDGTAARARRILLVSGASGGSVGAYGFATELERRACLAPFWYRRWFARDLLGPVVGWGLGHDLPALLFHQRPRTGATCVRRGCDLLRDRARILEESLDEDVALARTRGVRSPVSPALPHLVFNTSSDRLDRRVLVSPLKHPAEARVVENALDANCADGDLPLVSGAVLSARFPVATPTGRIVCARRALVDGGYLENTGLGAIAELLPQIVDAVTTINRENAAHALPSIRIEVIEISNGPRGPATPLRSVSRSATVPHPTEALLSLVRLPSYPTDQARAALATRCGDGLVSFTTIRPQIAPGFKASVGWRMSRAARSELERALVAAAGPATAVLETTRPARVVACS